MKGYGINTIFFQVRSHDNAAWRSKTFNASRYLAGSDGAQETGYEAYSYDPLKLLVRLTHKYGMELHAWLNPYRTSDYTFFYDPGKASTKKRVLKAVKEVLKYDVDGIHIDDYFYNAVSGYVTVKKPKEYYSIIANKGDAHKYSKYKVVSYAKRKKKVNELVREIYSLCHQKNIVFGISPAGDTGNCERGGADIKTWLNSGGYLDYIVPQCYWSDEYGTSGAVSEYTNSLKEWKALNKLGKKMYIGLALYKTGSIISYDPGWKNHSNNLKKQIKKLRKYGMKGFVFFSAIDFYESHAVDELKKVKKLLS